MERKEKLNGAWRGCKPTDLQIEYLSAFGIDAFRMTRGEASDAIDSLREKGKKPHVFYDAFDIDYE